MGKAYHFRIADFAIKLAFDGTSQNSIELLPSFGIFACEAEHGRLLFTLDVDDNIRFIKGGSLIRKFDTGNGDTSVYAMGDGGYQYVVRNLANLDCCLLQTNKDFSQCKCALNGNWTMRSFGLNNALMLIFAFAASRHGALLIHASCVRNGGFAYPFIAKSGTGKSTHSDLWLKNIPGTDLMNDDNPIIRVTDGTPYLYGSPWSGKTPCYRNVKAPLGAITRIERADANSIERLRPALAFASVLPACSSMKWDSGIYRNLCDTITQIIETVPVFTLHCLPDNNAAILCHKTIARHK